MGTSEVREAVNAGPRAFYPSDPEELSRMLENLFSAVEVEQDITPLALVVPHAGYVYSGQTAAYAYKLLAGKHFDRVIILAPSHYVAFGGASVFEGSAFSTPLGPIAVDTQFVDTLRSLSPQFRYVPEVELREHSLEVQLPMLQHALGEFSLVPVMLFERSLANCTQIAKTLAQALAGDSQRTLVVASSDLYHGPDHHRAREKSEQVAQALCSFSPQAFCQGIESEELQACGGGSIASTLMLAQSLGANRCRVLHLTTSFEVCPGNENWVVGYLSAALYRGES